MTAKKIKIDARKVHEKNGVVVNNTTVEPKEVKAPGAFGKAGGRGKKSPEESSIVIPRPEMVTLQIPILGVAPLVTHAWSEKARKMMLDKQQNKARAPREVKDPVAEFKAAMYRFPNGDHGVPAVSFKAAMVDACRLCQGLPMTLAKLLFWIEPDGRDVKENKDLIRIFNPEDEGKKGKKDKNGVEWPIMREDTPRLANGNPDLRYRPEYDPWGAVLRVRFNAGMVSAEQVYNLVMLAGIHCGICEMRPSSPESKTGCYGLWECK